MMKSILLTSVLLLGLFSCGESETRPKEYKEADKAFCDSLRSWGAADAHIDDHSILLFGAYKGQIVADPDEVAKLWYEHATGIGIKGLKGCRIVELPANKILGSYYHTGE